MDARRSTRILLIEDDLDAADAFREILESEGYHVAVAHTGEDGLRLASALCPGVLLCDLSLPSMDGFEVAKRFRRDPALQPTHLIAISGLGSPEDREHARVAGFDSHLTKPIDVSRLLDRLRSLESRVNSFVEPRPTDGA